MSTDKKGAREMKVLTRQVSIQAGLLILVVGAYSQFQTSSLSLNSLAPAQSAKAKPQETGFSFEVYGDSRSMMYLPHRSDQKQETIDQLVEMFELVLPEKVAKEVVQKDVKLVYDPATKELAQVIMPFMTHSEVTYMTLDRGWVTEAAVEDVK